MDTSKELSQEQVDDEVWAHFEALPDRSSNRKIVLNKQQTTMLVRAVRAGKSFPDIARTFTKLGWPGGPDTLRRIYREEEAKEGTQ